MPIYKRNNKWYAVINYVGLNGKYKKAQSKYFDTKREATEAEIVLRQKYKNADRYSITFEEAFHEYRIHKQEEIKPQSVINLDNLFAYAKPLNKIKVEKLTKQQYTVFKSDLDRQNISTEYKNKIHRLVCKIIDYCNQQYGIYNDVPKKCGGFHSHDTKKEMQFFTIDEFEKFIAVEDDIVYQALFTLLFFNGLRIGEALALTWQDYDGNYININKTLVSRVKGVKPFTSSPKTNASNRLLPVNDRVKTLLDAVLARYRGFSNFDDQWFIFGGIKPISTSLVSWHKNANCEKAHVKRIRVHDFRHSCASYYIKEKNAPIILISKLLGHSKISMTLDTYSHLYPNELDQIIRG